MEINDKNAEKIWRNLDIMDNIAKELMLDEADLTTRNLGKDLAAYVQNCQILLVDSFIALDDIAEVLAGRVT